MAADFPYVYPLSFNEAWNRKELDQYNDSLYLNALCAHAIEQAISNLFSEGGFWDGCPKTVLEQYGFKRVNFVLANTVDMVSDPSLISEDTHQWCKKIAVPPEQGYNRLFAVHTSASQLESFIAQTRQAYQALGLFGPEHCVGDQHALDYEGKVLVLSPDTLREGCWSPKNQLWYAHDGFSCTPNAIGRSIRATCLGDGEMTRWNRSDFIGVLDEQYLPYWAAEKLAELRGPEQEQTAGPTMGGMMME